MIRMPAQTTLVQRDPEQGIAALWVGNSWAYTRGWLALLEPVRCAPERRVPSLTSTRWPATGLAWAWPGEEVQQVIELLVIRASSSIFLFAGRGVGEAETESLSSAHSSDAVSTAGVAVVPPRRETESERAQQLVVGAFADFREVTAVYTQRYREELQVVVLLGVSRYDDELMNGLLDREYQVQKAVRRPVVSFSYIPKVYQNRSDIVHPGATLIYER